MKAVRKPETIATGLSFSSIKYKDQSTGRADEIPIPRDGLIVDLGPKRVGRCTLVYDVSLRVLLVLGAGPVY
jgi:hypothetical protein